MGSLSMGSLSRGSVSKRRSLSLTETHETETPSRVKSGLCTFYSNAFLFLFISVKEQKDIKENLGGK